MKDFQISINLIHTINGKDGRLETVRSRDFCTSDILTVNTQWNVIIDVIIHTTSVQNLVTPKISELVTIINQVLKLGLGPISP